MIHFSHRLPPRAVLLVALVATGCSERLQLAEVKGQVLLNGQPLKNVRLDFQPDPDKGTTGKGSTGTTDDNGNFALTYEGSRPGAIVGHHRVTVTDLDVFGNVFVGRGDYRTEDPKGPKETPKMARFGAHYSDLAQTPFKEEVRPGMGPVTLNLKK